MSDLRSALRGLDVFRSLVDEDLDALAASFVEQRYGRGETVELRIGDDPVLLGVLVRGDAEWLSDALGFTNLREHESFGDLSTDFSFDSTVSVTVRRDATIARITRGAFMTFASRHPEAILSMVCSFAATLTHAQQRTSMLRVSRPGHVRTLVRRLAHWIVGPSR